MKNILKITVLFIVIAGIISYCNKTSDKEINAYLDQIHEVREQMIKIDTRSKEIFEDFSKKFLSEFTSNDLWDIADQLDKEVYPLTIGLVEQVESHKPRDKDLKYYHELYLQYAAELQSEGVLKAIMVGDASITDEQYFRAAGRAGMEEAFGMIKKAGHNLNRFDLKIKELKEE